MKVACAVLVMMLVASGMALADPKGRCGCATDIDCGCCLDNIPLVDDACGNVTWNSEDLSVTLELIVRNVVIDSATFYDHQQPQLCHTIVCDICVGVDNLNITTKGACGDITLNITCGGAPVFVGQIGDFHAGQGCVIPSVGYAQSTFPSVVASSSRQSALLPAVLGNHPAVKQAIDKLPLQFRRQLAL